MSLTPVQQLEQANQKLEHAKARRQRIQVQLEAARQQHAAATAEATEKYGTANVSELERKLAQLEGENASAVQAFTRAVDEFERYITQLETALANPEAMAKMLDSIGSDADQRADQQPPAAVVSANVEDDI